MASSSMPAKRIDSEDCSKPVCGMITQSAVMMQRTCSMLNTMALSLTRIFPVSDVSRFGSKSLMSRMGTPSRNFCSATESNQQAGAMVLSCIDCLLTWSSRAAFGSLMSLHPQLLQCSSRSSMSAGEQQNLNVTINHSGLCGQVEGFSERGFLLWAMLQ